ncbi:hypothetical protein [Streptomyces sp. NPDC058755]|uniref:hypothetical protein n=1 Tax=Streptomyces sp. NPDC058755 TaxID=3346624 RepID=UPI00367848D2
MRAEVGRHQPGRRSQHRRQATRRGGWEVYEDDPKTDTGARTIALDSDTVRALRRHRAQQDKDRKEWESAWVETGRVFTQENGELLQLANVTRRFIELYEEIDLPPVRLQRRIWRSLRPLLGSSAARPRHLRERRPGSGARARRHVEARPGGRAGWS